MKEDFLQYLWRFRKFKTLSLLTSQGEPFEIIHPGTPNEHAGPDFFNAQLKIGNQLWAGNVEIHVKASDWYLHGHEKDKAYTNVILHVVWEDDVAVFRADDSVLPAFVLKEVVDPSILENYKKRLYTRQTFINCENDLTAVPPVVIKNWLERLYVERLEEKSKLILAEQKAVANDWEAILFRLLMKNFGLNVNGTSFYSIAQAIDYSIVRKIQPDPLRLEALLFGLAGFLSDIPEDAYQAELKKEYEYLKYKHQWTDATLIPPVFFRLRPSNFPTIRLSQIAQLYSHQPNLFSEAMQARTVEEAYQCLRTSTAPYWKEHYTFGKKSPKKDKKLSTDFLQLLLINTLLPLKFCYATAMGKENIDEILQWVYQLNPETNTLVEMYKKFGVSASSAMESQALVQLNHNYCNKNACLRCAIGNDLLK